MRECVLVGSGGVGSLRLWLPTWIGSLMTTVRRPVPIGDLWMPSLVRPAVSLRVGDSVVPLWRYQTVSLRLLPS